MKLSQKSDVVVVGGGLAGSEAALFLANRGLKVALFEMRPNKFTEAHKTEYFGELVCSNSLKSEYLDTANGLLKKELEILGSSLLKIAQLTRVPAGNSLSVDRECFAKNVTDRVVSHKNITIFREEVDTLSFDTPVIVATGPLTSSKMVDELSLFFDKELFFYDAIAPIVDADTIDYSKCFFKSRYDKGGADYLNCPMNEDEFEKFYEALINAETVEFRDFEKGAVFERCMPIEEMAKRGKKTLTFGPMRPVGLEHNGEKHFAVVQLRKENSEGTAFNIVGFQTKMKVGEQKRVFRLIPGLENVEFLRYGSVHRNTYVFSPKKLDRNFKIKDRDIYIAGQLSGVEGYVESIGSGLVAAIDLFLRLKYDKFLQLPENSALRALGDYVSTYRESEFSPSNFHFGMLKPLDTKIKDKRKKKISLSERAIKSLEEYVISLPI